MGAQLAEYTGQGLGKHARLQALTQMNAMARQMEQSLPPALLEWGHAWLAAWGNAAFIGRALS